MRNLGFLIVNLVFRISYFESRISNEPSGLSYEWDKVFIVTIILFQLFANYLCNIVVKDCTVVYNGVQLSWSFWVACIKHLFGNDDIWSPAGTYIPLEFVTVEVGKETLNVHYITISISCMIFNLGSLNLLKNTGVLVLHVQYYNQFCVISKHALHTQSNTGRSLRSFWYQKTFFWFREFEFLILENWCKKLYFLQISKIQINWRITFTYLMNFSLTQK